MYCYCDLCDGLTDKHWHDKRKEDEFCIMLFTRNLHIAYNTLWMLIYYDVCNPSICHNLNGYFHSNTHHIVCSLWSTELVWARLISETRSRFRFQLVETRNDIKQRDHLSWTTSTFTMNKPSKHICTFNFSGLLLTI